MPNQLSELQESLIFRWEGNEWYPDIDLISGTRSTNTDVYNVLDRQGSGRRSLSFNGSSDYAYMSANGVGLASPSTYIIKFKTSSNITDSQWLLTSVQGSSDRQGIYLASGKIHYCNYDGTGSGSAGGSTTILANTDYTVVVVCVDGGRYGNRLVYINGVDVTTTGTYISPAATAGMTIGTISSYASGFFSGSISLVRIFNYALTPTQITNYSKPEYPIEWVDRGATGAELIALQADRDFSSAVNWTNTSMSSYDVSGDLSITATASAQLCRLPKVNAPTVIGKNYRMSFNVANLISDFNVANYAYNNIYGTTTSAATNTFSFIATDTGGIRMRSNSTTSSGDFDNFSLTQLGCVLDLNSSGLSQSTSGYWYDRTNTLTATNSGTSLVVPPASNLGATYFNGTTSNIAFTNKLDSYTSFSISAWILNTNTFNYSNFDVIYGEGMNGNSGLIFGLNGQKLALVMPNSSYEDVVSSGSITANIWTHCVITFDGTNVRLYINKTLDKTQARTKVSSGGDAGIIGAALSGSGSWATQYFNGLISNVSLYKEALDADRIRLIYDTNF